MLFRFITLLSAFLCSLSTYAASGLDDVELRDLYFGEILFYAYQDLHFDALARLDNELSQYHELDESTLDPFHQHLGQAEFSVGDFELQYRMNQRAGKAIQAVLGEGVDVAIRNQAAYSLARLFYKKNDPQSTLYALDLILDDVEKSRYEEKYSLNILRGKEPETFETDVAYLRALASIDTGQFGEAVKLLQALKKEPSLKGYVAYNLGIALIQNGQENEGLIVLDELGRLETNDPGLVAIKDKTNLKLAYRWLEKGDANKAQQYFGLVRLDGPYSNAALLGAGWVAVSQGKFDRALVPWSMLHERAETNYSVQEVLMAVPYAYGKLEAHGKAANLYNHAMDVFVREIASLDDSIKSIRTGKLLTALLDEKSKKDKNWVVNLRDMEETPETRYILELMIEIRRAYQQPLLPVVEEKFKKLDARIKLRLEQRENLATKLKNMLISPRPEYLATAIERQALDTVNALEEIRLTNPAAISDDVALRIQRLRGILTWRVHSEYEQRLTDAYNNLVSLDEIITELKIRYHSFIRTRQAATQSYEGYTIPIRQLRTRLFSAQRKLKGVMAKQGRLIETMAISELDRRRKRLEEYQIKARFALAESYDRATKAQLDEEIEKQLQKQAPADSPVPEVKQELPVEQENEIQPPPQDGSPEEGQVEKSSSFKDKLLNR
jgi:Flp pilus assembly protein TadD